MSHNLDNTPTFKGRSSVDWAIKNKLIVGDNYGNFKLNKDVTKQEALEFIYKLFQMLNEKEK